MATLYKRATPSQRRVLRIVEGAIKNACDAHPGQYVPSRLARSIAKRATGTLTAQWPDVLAARMPSIRAGSDNLLIAPPSSGSITKPTKRGVAYCKSHTPTFRAIYKRLGLMAGWARNAGKEQRAAAFADALRAVSSIEHEMSGPSIDGAASEQG